MVAISTRNATPAPTATPMITAIGTDSARGKSRSMKLGRRSERWFFSPPPSQGTYPWLLESGWVRCPRRVLGPNRPHSPLPCPCADDPPAQAACGTLPCSLCASVSPGRERRGQKVDHLSLGNEEL